jgi:dihydroxyacetone kinase
VRATLDGEVVVATLRAALESVAAAEEMLGGLDAAAGDGDHGRGVVRGFRAAAAAADENGTGSVRLQRAGAAFSDAAGGASGMLFGTILGTLGDSLEGGEINAVAVGRAFRSALDAVTEIGDARPGDKTLVDALAPFVERFEQLAREGKTIAACWVASAAAAEEGAEGTAALVARRGRSARLGERSRGVRDPGATSLALVLRSAGAVVEARCAPGVG